MKIGIFQDIHANLPALKKAIEIFRQKGCSKIYHVGDLIGIGPYPKEVFELANSIEELELIMGNHDYWFAFGIPEPLPELMNKEEAAHQRWNHLQIGHEHRHITQKWKFVDKLELSNNRSLSFLHYGYDPEQNWFREYVPIPNNNNLDILFKDFESDIVFYGHNHEESDIQGNSRYVNLGSAGCYHKSEVRLGILEVTDDELILEKLSIPYEDNGLMEAFEIRQVPAREFITKVFITRNSA